MPVVITGWSEIPSCGLKFEIVDSKKEAEKMADRIAIIDHGNIVAQGTSEELKNQTKTASLEDAFLALTGKAIRDEEASRALARDLRDRIAKGEDFAALAKKYSDDPGSKNSGGDLGWQPPGVFAPEFQTAIDALAKDEVSAPFHTQFGWHIAKIVDRRERDATIEARRGRVRQSIQQRKEAEEFDTWLRRLRAEAYVEYRMNADSPTAAKPAS